MNRSSLSLLVLVLLACTREQTEERTLADPPSNAESAAQAPAIVPFAEVADIEGGPARGDIVDGAKQGMKPVIGCVKTARAAGEVEPGLYTLTLDWDILPDGTVANPAMTGPSFLLHTSLPECFTEKMRGWSFPKTSHGGPVRNFPFGPFEVK